MLCPLSEFQSTIIDNLQKFLILMLTYLTANDERVEAAKLI